MKEQQRNERWFNTRSETRIKSKCKYRRIAGHGNAEPVTIQEPLDMLEELGRGKLIDMNEKIGCDEKNTDV